MGLFDRLLGGNKSVSVTGAAKPAKKQEEAFFLDADASSSMGNVEFMRRSNTIRHTFPGTASSPGDKELVEEVASMEMRREKATPGLGGVEEKQEEINLTGGIPKPVKKTFAEQMSKAELDQRMKGSAVGVNTPGQANAKLQTPTEAQPQITTQQPTSKPGDIGAFKGWVKDL
ncbi:MAG: hypothetical protein FJ076_07725 [Cyanobacteria bacterium K_DeepCast_35m_m1_288]|jgi:hypothetical protein|uniref:hypothetical protein n=1 Tax=Vulcanococcus sp. TaxID=2856995 RepID=UPI0025D99475|nr:hypothetical protein [Vulcanococcus sp.]MBM5784712.1 hypothetical protein [Cyanobacteria bacterium K_DeepCast_35m_m1_288]MBW0167681.1 hypothetical protein [Vulcanococcus sp.]